MKTIPAIWFATLLAFGAPSPTNRALAQETAHAGEIQNGSVVSMEYTLSDEKGQVMDTNKGKDPMIFSQGGHQIIPGLEKELAGMKVGEQKKVQVKPEDAYGPVNPNAFQEVPKDKLPAESLKVGTILMAHGPQGQPIPARVHEIKESTVIMDFNHPMAGKTLFFDVKILAIKSAEK